MRKCNTLGSVEDEMDLYLRSSDTFTGGRRFVIVLNALVGESNRIAVQLKLAKERYA